MRAANPGQRHLDWLNQCLPPLRRSALNDMMSMYKRDEFAAPLNIARSHLQLLAGAPDVTDATRLDAFQFSAAPAGAMQLDLGDLRKQWNIIKQPSWSDLLDDPDLKDQLLKELTAALGDHAAKFLEQQGGTNAKEVLKATAAGWKLEFASLVSVLEEEGGTYYLVGGDYQIAQSQSVTGITRTIKINLSRAENNSYRSATDAEINAAISTAMRDQNVTDYGTGITPMDSVAAAAFDAFASHPNRADQRGQGRSKGSGLFESRFLPLPQQKRLLTPLICS